MRRLRFPVPLVLLAVAVLAVAGCSVDRNNPAAPQQAALTTQAAPGVAAARLGDAVATRPDIASTMAAQDRATPALLAQSGVIGTGTSVDEQGRPVIVVLTERHAVTGIPATIEGVPTRVEFIGTVTAYAQPLRPYARPGGGPLQMGTSTGNDLECASGTLGCVVNRGGTRYFLSNNHVFARENAGRAGERIDAPGRYDGKPKCAQTPQIGTLADYKAISFSSNNTIDAATTLPSSGLSYTGAEAGGYTPSSTVVAPSVGLACKKTGRTSGLTSGSVQAINVTIRVQYSGGQIATFVSQIQFPGSFIRSGDSGSLAVTSSGNNPVALMFAGGSGGSFGNPISDVLSYFNATVAQ